MQAGQGLWIRAGYRSRFMQILKFGYADFKL